MNIKLIVSVFLLITFSNNAFSQKTIKEEFTLPAADGIQLAGEIEYPNKAGKFPAAILIWGNGPHTRDEEISGTPIFKQIAEELLKEDMVVLRMDKRGFGKSTGENITSEGNYTTQDLADDVKLAYDLLNKHKSVDTTRVGLIGHSEGTMIASILSAEDKSIDWIIAFGPVAVSGQKVVVEQMELNRKRLGMSDEVSTNISKVWDKYVEFVKDGYKNDSIYYAIGREFLVAHGLDENDERITNEFINQLLDGYKTPWNQYFFLNNNAENLEKVQVPFLAIFGGKDDQTTVDLNLVPLNNALSKAENKNYKIVVLADEDHYFFRYKGERMEKHKFGEMKMSVKFLTTIKEWLTAEGIIK
jgi:pimeloyl-ACP methyl ester carboxylesterase